MEGVGGSGDSRRFSGLRSSAAFCEIERSRDDRLAVDYHNLIVGDRMFGVAIGRDSSVLHEIRRGILFGALALVQDHFDMHAPLVGIDKGFGNRG